MANLNDVLDILGPPSEGSNAPSKTHADDVIDMLNSSPSGSPTPSPAASGAATAPPGDDYAYNPSLLPVKRVAPGKGMFSIGSHSYDLVVPGIARGVAQIPKDFVDTAEGARAAWESGDINAMNSAALKALPYAVGAPPAVAAAKALPEAAGVIGKDIQAVGAMAPKEVPMTMDQATSASKDAYKRSEVGGVWIKPDAFKNFSDELRPTLRRDVGYHPTLQPNASAPLEEAEKMADSGQAQTLSELETLRRIAGSAAANSQNDNQYKAASILINKITGFMDTLGPGSLVHGNMDDAKVATDALNEARPLWNKRMKMSDIQDILDVSQNLDDPNKYIKQQFTRIVKDKDRFNTFTPDEQKLITQVQKTGKIEVLANWLAPTHGASGMWKPLIASGLGGTAGATIGQPVAGAALGATAGPVVGLVAKHASDAARMSTIGDLQNTISLGHTPLTALERYQAARARLRGGIQP